jgi:methyl-accepting chemotaxis protein
MATSISFDLLSDYTLVKEEEQRKIRSLKLYSILCGILAVMAITTGTITNIMSQNFSWSTYISSSIFLVSSITSYWLARNKYYYGGAWLLIGILSVLLGISQIQVPISTPLYLIYLVPIGLALSLLGSKETIFLSLVCVGFAFTVLIIQGLRGIAPLNQNQLASLFVTHIFLLVVVVPVIIVLMIVPARAQAKILLTQNRRLIEALGKLRARQQIIEEVSHNVLDVSAELKTTATQQNKGSREQVSAVTQVNASVSELSTTASHIADLAQQVSKSSEMMAQDSRQIEETAQKSATQAKNGFGAVNQTIAVSQEVAALYQELTANLNDLNVKGASMRRIVQLLGTITNETHLLSLNAAIEAAGAGEYGSRFAVVAQQVKMLALNAGKAQNEVIQVVTQIENAANITVEKVQNGYQKALEMAHVAHQAGHAINEMAVVTQQAQAQATSITHTAKNVRELGDVIRLATNQQRTASEQVLSALSGLVVVAEQNAKGSESVTATVLNLEEVSQRLKTSLTV